MLERLGFFHTLCLQIVPPVGLEDFDYMKNSGFALFRLHFSKYHTYLISLEKQMYNAQTRLLCNKPHIKVGMYKIKTSRSLIISILNIIKQNIPLLHEEGILTLPSVLFVVMG